MTVSSPDPGTVETPNLVTRRKALASVTTLAQTIIDAKATA